MKRKITQSDATISEKNFRVRLPGTVWDARLEVVSVRDKKTYMLLNPSRPNLEEKNLVKFLFSRFFVVPQGLQAFITPFEAPQSVKTKI